MKKHRKKAIYLAVLAVVLFSLPGCSDRGEEQKPGQEIEGTDNVETKSETGEKITAEDFQNGTPFIMKTEKGYYYYHRVYGEEGISAFRYIDATTGKDIYLCNKPECKHDGNSFCVATNKKYRIAQVCLYSGRIFATAIEETDTQYIGKLLSIALDGSEMSEVATFVTLEKMASEGEGMRLVQAGEGRKLLIHRNKAVISLRAIGQMGGEVDYCGTAVLDLDTRKVSYLDEEPLSRENLKAQGIKANGDYIYYYKKEGKRNILHRYCVKDGTDESYMLQPGFQGMYAILDEDNIVYRRGIESIIYLYHPSTGETQEVKNLSRKHTYMALSETGEEEEVTVDDNIAIAAIMTDGTYLYLPRQSFDRGKRDGTVEKVREIYVLNRNFEEVAMVDMIKALPDGLEDVRPYYKSESCWSYLGDEIYVMLQEDPYPVIYKCKRNDFLEGNPKFELLYKEGE